MINNFVKKVLKNTVAIKLPAFNVAEVVIALAVIGVVATTVSSVVYFNKNTSGYKNKDLVATLQNQVIKLNRAYKVALAERDDLDRWVDGSTKMSTTTDKNALFAKVLESYSPSTKSCGSSTDGDCFPTSTTSGTSSVNYNANSDYYKIRTTDGASVAYKITDPMCNGVGVSGKDKGVCGEIIIDTNGNKGPNKEGLDTFRLGIFHNGVRTFNAGCSDPLNSASVLITTGESCYEDFNVTVCPKDTPEKCHNCSGKVVCVKTTAACTALQQSEGCAPDSCPDGTVPYYSATEGKVSCITEPEKACYETIKKTPDACWDKVNKTCLDPENCCKNIKNGYWKLDICWDSEQQYCEAKQTIYVSSRTEGDRCVAQDTYCTNATKDGGLGGWLWTENVCCTATTVSANTEPRCCEQYGNNHGSTLNARKTDYSTYQSSKGTTWWGKNRCCYSNKKESADDFISSIGIEECCTAKGGFWSGGKCYKSGKDHCEAKTDQGGLGGTWIAESNQCCTTGIMSGDGCSTKKCYPTQKAKCEDAAPCGEGGKWANGQKIGNETYPDICCKSNTDSRICCDGARFETCNGKNYCFGTEEKYCTESKANCGLGGWWDGRAVHSNEYTEVPGCCTNTSSQVCCNSANGGLYWWNGSSCCTSGEDTQACCIANDNGHESRYWTGVTASNPKVCWKNASDYCISSSGLSGWVFIEDSTTASNSSVYSINGVCCTDTAKNSKTNDSGNGYIKHQGQYDRLDDSKYSSGDNEKYSKLCCINNSDLNSHRRFRWYTDNYISNTGYCWFNDDELCQDQTSSNNDHGLGGWYWYQEAQNSNKSTCCSIRTYETKGKTVTGYTKIDPNNPPKNSDGTAKNYTTYDLDIRNQSDYSTKTCCVNPETKGSRKTGYNITYANKIDYGNTAVSIARLLWTSKAKNDVTGYCWAQESEYCTTHTDVTSEGLSGWDYDKSTRQCCSEIATSGTTYPIWTTLKSQDNLTVTIKGQDINNNSASTTNSTEYCCLSPDVNPDTGVAAKNAASHTRKFWTKGSETFNQKGDFCWISKAELCQAQTADGNTSATDHGMGGWLWETNSNSCCTVAIAADKEQKVYTQKTVEKSNGKNVVKSHDTTIPVLNQSHDSNYYCCTSTITKGRNGTIGRTGVSGAAAVVPRQYWTDSNWTDGSNGVFTGTNLSKYHLNNASPKKGYCWLNENDLCTTQTTNDGSAGSDLGMGGWYWDSANSKCCTTHYNTTPANRPNGPVYNDITTQTVYKAGGSSTTIAVRNQAETSNKNCCTNSSTKGGHTRFNWTSGNYRASGDDVNSSGNGFCWVDDNELCQAQTYLSGTYTGTDHGMGGWYWDSANSKCCTVQYNKSGGGVNSQTVYRKGASSASVAVKNQAETSNKNCCTNSSSKGGHTRYNWTSGNYAHSGDDVNTNGYGYCWLDDNELCQNQTDTTSDHGMGGWYWDSANSKCCTIKYNKNGGGVNSQTVYRKGASSASVAVKNQAETSNKNCCTNSTAKGGHVRFNWTSGNYAHSGDDVNTNGYGYCWYNDDELCQDQTDTTSDHGMGGWYWDSANSKCCTIKYNKAGGGVNSQTVYRKGASSATVSVKNQQETSSKNCCTNSNDKGGHTRFNWTDDNYGRKGGYCWYNDDELCQDQTSTTNDYGMGGWYWDGSNCCTIKTTSSQTVYRKGASSASVAVKNQSDSSNKACCTNNNDKGGHTRFNWIDNNYAGNGGYCWLTDEELCQSQTGTSSDHGMGGWYWDGSNCCTINTTSSQTVYRKGGGSASVSVKNQSDSSNKACCTNGESKGNHTRFNWTDNNYAGNGGYCWYNDDELCQDQTGTSSDHGMGGWYWDGSNCCTDQSSQTVYRKGGGSATVSVKNQSDSSNEACCTNGSSKGGHTRFNWINSKCWESMEEYCTTSTSSNGAGGYAWDSTNTVCCTQNKTGNGTISVKTKNGGSDTITFKNHDDTESAVDGSSSDYCCKQHHGNGAKVCNGNCYANAHVNRFACACYTNGNGHYINGHCWDSKSEFCTSTSNGGLSGAYQDDNVCCKAGTSSDNYTGYTGVKGATSYTINLRDEHYSAVCCANAKTNYYYFNSKCWASKSDYCTTSTGSSGLGGSTLIGDNCCVEDATETTKTGDRGGSSTSVYVKNQNSDSPCCKGIKGNGAVHCNSTCYWNGADASSAACACYTANSNPTGCYANITCYDKGENNSDEECVCRTSGAKRCNGTCYHAQGDSDAACKCHSGSSDGKVCSGTCYPHSTDSLAACKCHTGSDDAVWCTGACYKNSTVSDAACQCATGSSSAKVCSNTCYKNSTINDAACQCHTGSSEAKICSGTCYAKKTDSDDACKCIKGNGAKLCSGTCYPNSTDSVDACKCHTGKSGAYLAGSTCCGSEDDSETCCKSSNNPNGAGTSYASGKCKHCESAGQSEACCTAEGGCWHTQSGKCWFASQISIPPECCIGYEFLSGSCCYLGEKTNDSCCNAKHSDGTWKLDSSGNCVKQPDPISCTVTITFTARTDSASGYTYCSQCGSVVPGSFDTSVTYNNSKCANDGYGRPNMILRYKKFKQVNAHPGCGSVEVGPQTGYTENMFGSGTYTPGFTCSTSGGTILDNLEPSKTIYMLKHGYGGMTYQEGSCELTSSGNNKSCSYSWTAQP